MYITIDIGGTNLRISAYKTLEPESFVQKEQFLSKDFQKYGFAINKLSDEIKKLTGSEKIDGIAISITGEVDPVKKILVDSDSFKYWEGFNIAQDLEERLQCSNIKIENDAVVAGLADRYFGEGKNHKSMGFIIVGTGAGAVRLQKVEDKDFIYPTEFGHIIIVPDGEKCVCGQRGCLEAYASG